MNTVILGLILVFGVNDSSAEAKDYSWVLEEMKNEIEIFDDSPLSEDRIRIFDLGGTLLGEYEQEKVIRNELPLSDLRKIQNSDYLFDYQGDSYYLRE